MQVTHVLRGDDHISNTPKQIALYRALGGGAALPVFGHVPMINGPDGKKLSKRHGATAVGDYQHMGILPAAMRNFLALLGWSPGGDREIMTREEMVRLFSFAGIQQKGAKELAKDPAGYKASLEASLAVLRGADWTPETLEQHLRGLAEQRGVAAGKVFQPIRIALTGGTVSEPVNELLYVVGKDAALKRLESAISGSIPG